ncbi:aquaporin Z [Streptococcus pneumoniae]|nr:aquaporin Z [Streptococcus pneumoniae]CIV67711.1 aquaporin Z [Streptococcus pneumoniae]CIV67733.1 aquaporin Z [Streptococcus pneumoniae]
MYQDLLRKIAEEKPNYNQEEIQWLFDHLGNPSPEIRDDLSNQGLHYLSKEKDTTGFSIKYNLI